MDEHRVTSNELFWAVGPTTRVQTISIWLSGGDDVGWVAEIHGRRRENATKTPHHPESQLQPTVESVRQSLINHFPLQSNPQKQLLPIDAAQLYKQVFSL